MTNERVSKRIITGFACSLACAFCFHGRTFGILLTTRVT